MRKRDPSAASRGATTIVVPPGTDARLDVFLWEAAGLSRRTSRERIAGGAVRVNQRRAQKGQRVAAGDRVDLVPIREEDDPTSPPSRDVAILFEDDDMVIVDKPAGLPSVGVGERSRATIAGFLAARLPPPLSDAAFEGGLVQRLDNDTSGVMIAGKTPAARAELRRQLRSRSVGKTYLAVVHGDCAIGSSVDTPIGHVPRRPRRMAALAELPRGSRARAREAATRYRPLERFAIATLLEVSTATGVRHQIRVHLASIGHPIAGDALYAPKPTPDLAGIAIPRLLLHARRIRFLHPASGQVVDALSPVPAEMRDVLRQLRRQSRPNAGSSVDSSREEKQDSTGPTPSRGAGRIRGR